MRWRAAFPFAPLVGAFIAPASRWSVSHEIEQASAVAPGVTTRTPSRTAAGAEAGFGGTFKANAILFVSALFVACSRRGGLVRRRGGGGQNQSLSVNVKTSPQGVTGARHWAVQKNKWHRLREVSRRGTRKLHMQKKLRKMGITAHAEGWATYTTTLEWCQTYHGPESHPDNPFFPAVSTGRPSDTLHMDAVAPVTKTLFGSSAPQASNPGSLFAGRTATSLFERSAGPSGRRKALMIMQAHKKAAASTRWQGHSAPLPKHWGVHKYDGWQGQQVKNSTQLVKQKGQKYKPGANIAMGSNFNLHAKRAGTVQWRGTKGHMEVFIVPRQYVEERCVLWENRTHRRLLPNKYEPWMNSSHRFYQRRIGYMREDWLKTDEGEAWLKKKEEKEAKNKKKAVRRWADYATARKFRREKREAKKLLETVDASGSDTETES